MTTNLHPALTHRIIINGGQWARGESEHDAREQFRRLHSSRPLKPTETQVWAVMEGTGINGDGRFCRPYAPTTNREWVAPVLLDPPSRSKSKHKANNKPWERCGIHGPAEDRVWACPTCLVELRTEAEALRADAERYRFLERDFSPMGLNADGNHAWAYRRNATLKGPTLSAAIDAARGEA